MLAFTSDQWIIIALVFLLGLLVGGFLFAGSGRKWKTRYREETRRREEVEQNHVERQREFDEREKNWREQDSLRGAAIKDRDGPTRSDVDGDGVRDDADRRPTDDRRA
jgi:hypothetical protein